MGIDYFVPEIMETIQESPEVNVSHCGPIFDSPAVVAAALGEEEEHVDNNKLAAYRQSNLPLSGGPFR